MKLLLYFLCIIWLAACSHVSTDPKRPATPNGDKKSAASAVRFELIDRKKGQFRITNQSRNAITLDSLFGNDSKYGYSPAYATYEYLNGNAWVPLKWWGDAFVYPYTLAPGKKVVFEQGFDDERLKRLKSGTLVRLRIGDFVSESFRW